MLLRPSAALAGDDALRKVANRVPAVESAETLARAGSPDAVQAQYDAARDLEESAQRALPISRSCKRLLNAVVGFGRAEVSQAEGFDRQSQIQILKGRRLARAYRARVRLALPTCRSGLPHAVAAASEIGSPKSNEISFGWIDMPAPSGAESADLSVNGQVVRQTPVSGRRLRVHIDLVPGRYTFGVAFRSSDGRVVGRNTSRNVWLLPSSASRRKPARTRDIAIGSSLRELSRGFAGFSGMWAHDLSTGRYANSNSDAVFPAASTVKLGVLVAALRKYGPRPERSSVGYDLQALTAWSSNLASNRLLVLLGGSVQSGTALAQAELSRLGARSSTFTGIYRVGTVLRAGSRRADIVNPPPRVSSRVTTASDLGRILYNLHAGATGDNRALHRMRLTSHEAQLGLNLLLSSQPAGQNLGLFRSHVDRSTPIAQKNGWLSNARHTAAIVYAPGGPQIVVLLTYRNGQLNPRDAVVLGGQLLRQSARLSR